MERFSEAYSPTGGLAAEGVLNQLGRPDVELLEVLVREAVQNCWDAKRADASGIRVEIGRTTLDADQLALVRARLLVDPPPGLPLADELVVGTRILSFADFGTDGLGGPTRADVAGEPRDFIDFIRNIGQPPDKDFGGGSFGYGKAAFYLASAARTVVVDTLCSREDGGVERRLMACGLGHGFTEAGRPYTGRHWWGRDIDGIPEPVVGEVAAEAARALGLPERDGTERRGTTVAIIAPEVAPEAEDATDQTMGFIAEALIWNFWPRMIDTPGGVRRTMEFRLRDDGARVTVPDPRSHPRLRGFVEAMDRMREEPGEDDEFTLDRAITSARPARTLGRLVIQKGPVAPLTPTGRAMPQGARVTANAVHHVALMRTPEIIVRYLQGMAPVAGRTGYSGVFKCALDVDEAFKNAEPPTHDDWVHRFVHDPAERSVVRKAMTRVTAICREAAGYGASVRSMSATEGIPLGEFADALATLMPGFEGPGARRAPSRSPRSTGRRRRPSARGAEDDGIRDVWVDGQATMDGSASSTAPARAPRPPQARAGGEPVPAMDSRGTPVIRYPFELRGHGSPIRLTARVEVMTNDGGQVEADAPVGHDPPAVLAWIDPLGREHRASEVSATAEEADGGWIVEVEFRDDMMMRVDITPEIA